MGSPAIGDDVVIRAATPGDDHRVGALLAASYGALLAASYGELLAGAYPPELLRAAMPALTEPNARLLASGHFFVAIEGEAMIGCGGWSFAIPGRDSDAPSAPSAVAHLRHFAVHPAAARRGVGHRLLTKSREEARAAGASQLEVLATRNAVAFYARAGLVEQERVDVPIGDVAFPAVVMRGPA